jgi:hypothetical protein
VRGGRLDRHARRTGPRRRQGLAARAGPGYQRQSEEAGEDREPRPRRQAFGWRASRDILGSMRHGTRDVAPCGRAL